MSTAPHSNLTGGAQAPPFGANRSRGGAWFNPNTIRREVQERAQRAAQQSRKAALSLAQAGLYTFPCKPDKTPLDGLRWQTESTTNAAKIETWWARHPGAIPAVDCQKSGLVVLDLDRHDGGPDGVAAGEALLGDLHALGAPITLTRNEGLHIFFAAPPGEKIGNSAGSLPRGIDVRSRGYVIAPGAMLADGSGWMSDPDAPDFAEAFAARTIPELPQHVLDLIRSRPERPERAEPPRQRADGGPRTMSGDIGERERTYACKALDGEVRELAATPQGQRNPRLNEAALKIGHYVAAGWIGEPEVRQALEDACFANGLAQDDGIASVRKTIDSGLRKGMQEPAPPLADRERPDARDGRETPRFTKRDRPRDENADDADQGAAARATGTGSDPLEDVIFDGDEEPLPPDFLIDLLFSLRDIVILGGQSGAAKTFLLIYILVCLAANEPFFGLEAAERVGSVFLAAEGQGTAIPRLTAARNDKAGGEILPIAIIKKVPNLADPREVKALIPRLRRIGERFQETHGVRLGVVAIDTMAAAFAIEDENSNSQAAAAIRSMNLIAQALDVAVIVTHHHGKDAATGLRGASAFRAGADVVLSALADRDLNSGDCRNRRIALSKSRVGEEGWNAPFELRFVPLGVDKKGKTFGAAVIEPGQPEATIYATVKKEAAPPRAARVFLDALGIVLGEQGSKVRPFGFDGPEVVAVDRETIRSEFYRLWPADGDSDKARMAAKRQAFKRGEEWALQNKRIATYEVACKQMVWLLKEKGQ